MKFSEITNRITGLSCPIFGVSWDPPESERSVCRRIITFLEDRRVLFVPSSVEIPEHCVHSVIEIRHFLTEELGQLEPDSTLGQALSAMRAACRKFINTVQAEEGRIVQFGSSPGHYASWVFISALGEMRGVFGIHIATLAAAYGLDVEEELSSILPEVKDAS